MEKSTIQVESLDEEDDFLLELAAVEAEAALAKRPRVSTPEGPYMTALKGSKSEQWQQSPLNPASKSGNFATTTGGFQRSDGGGVTADQDFPEKTCTCGVGLCLILTSSTQKNPGRKFYKCPIREENGGCGFFQWCDAVPSSGTTHSYGNTNDSKFPDHQCPCGAGSCRVLTAKTGENIGRQFYRCPIFEGSCGFFKWCNDNAVSSPTMYSFINTSNVGDSDSRGYQITKTGTPCYKCGKGHWARDCTVQSGNPVSDTGLVKSTSSSGECYKCGKQGHWARDCTAQSGNQMSEPAQVKSSSLSGECYKCGKQGHWARDCTDQSGNQQVQQGQGKSTSSGRDCYKCGKPGHWARDCTLATQSTGAPGKRQRQAF
ncbi:Cold shock protein 1 [Cardamine amara subsp. amara]|uniref:Cold shock protein 1 n=1 Tax=Cardamine amara subsp. amara TaxID=228776 RepID=A0ABD1B2L1_CARAN